MIQNTENIVSMLVLRFLTPPLPAQKKSPHCSGRALKEAHRSLMDFVPHLISLLIQSIVKIAKGMSNPMRCFTLHTPGENLFRQTVCGWHERKVVCDWVCVNHTWASPCHPLLGVASGSLHGFHTSYCAGTSCQIDISFILSDRRRWWRKRVFYCGCGWQYKITIYVNSHVHMQCVSEMFSLLCWAVSLIPEGDSFSLHFFLILLPDDCV